MSWLKRDISCPSYLIALLVFLISAWVFSQYGFEGTLFRDDAIYIYSGQQLAHGVPPYVSIFDNKGPLVPFISGIGVSIAALFNLDDILAVRITFLVLSSLAAVGLYLLGRTLFSSHKVGLLAAFVFIGFSGFGIHAASGPRAKTPMVLFEIASLLLTARKKWFWAGICSSLALLTWQPAGIYSLIVVLLAWLQSESRRAQVRNTLLAISGVLTPIIMVVLYFWSQGALNELVDGAILFNFSYMERIPYPLLEHILRPILFVNTGFQSMALPIFIGFFMVLFMYWWRLRLYGSSFLSLIRKDHFSALLLSFPIIIIWTLVDFQSYPDLFIFLPYVALGFGWLLHLALDSLLKIKENAAILQKLCFVILCAILIGSAALNYHAIAENGLEKERRWAERVEFQLWMSADTIDINKARLVSIGVPQVLVLLHRTNPNRYVFMTNGIDSKIDATTPGGFEDWLEELERYDPSVIVVGLTRGKFRLVLFDWLQSRYQETSIGEWRVFFRDPT